MDSGASGALALTSAIDRCQEVEPVRYNSVMVPDELEIREATDDDVAAITALRALWIPGADEAGFEARMAYWLAGEGSRRTIWLATLRTLPIGMASVFEYHRMPRPGRPDARWGYVSNMFVREEYRNRGVCARLMARIIRAAEERDCVRLVVSPSSRAAPFYGRAGFVVPDEMAGEHRLLVRPSTS